ncbi:MAG: precorrin-3B C(17)-methyltransferase [Nitrospirae bacterium]|nr:MAG: precorrin-3B C(17)-methyltransferase [Nitrospirota bacterium]
MGIGPGAHEHITSKALNALQSADLVVGYTKYLDLIREIIKGKECFETGMTREIDRCRHAIEEAEKGRAVALVCSGDPGVYAMAGLVFDLLKAEDRVVDVEVIPGIPALSACASVLGAPLMHDFASISLSDRLTPWELIERRLHAAASSDFVIVIYNPRSRGRKEHLKRAVEIVLSYRDAKTPVGVVKAASREAEEWFITTLSEIPYERVDMNTTLIIGNSSTYVWQDRMVTPRGYEGKYNLRDDQKI